MKPTLTGRKWYMTGNPDLGPLGSPEQEVVDHAIFQSADKAWHVWACIRKTAIGRLLYHWEGDSLLVGLFEPQGVAMRACRRYGESVLDVNGQEWIQAPFVFIENETYYMFYGGHSTETGECQICLATSSDGREFHRHLDESGRSRLFVGPGEARDPMVIKVFDHYLCYYSGHDPGRRQPCKIYCRRSPDLLRWSEPQAVNYGGVAGSGPWSAECPFVVVLDGFYYLFRTCRYSSPALTYVYCSTDPWDFGLDDDSCLVTSLPVAAPEVVQYNDRYYISTVEDLQGGIQLAELVWE